MSRVASTSHCMSHCICSTVSVLKKELKVGSGSLKEQLVTPEETCLTIMLARKEGGQKLFEIFRQGENEVSLASLGEVGHTIERTGGSAVNNRDMQKEAHKKYEEKMSEEFKELVERRAKEALKLVQKKHMFCPQSGKAKGKEQECRKDWEDRGRKKHWNSA